MTDSEPSAPEVHPEPADYEARRHIAIEPVPFAPYVEAVHSSGGVVTPLDGSVRALIWTDYSAPDSLASLLDANPQLEWVQLPFAGVDAFAHILERQVLFTSAKGAYREPVAEHALTLMLALARRIPKRARAVSWARSEADTLFDSEVLIVGGGGIAETLLALLAPFRAKVTVVRKRPQPMTGAARVLGFEGLDGALPEADFVVLAAALTPETLRLMDSSRLALMKSSAYLVNIARGGMVDTEALIRALESEGIAGAALDVTDPEPLPDGHPLWTTENILITPHSADTKAMVLRLFAERLRANVRAWLGEGEWFGVVERDLGY